MSTGTGWGRGTWGSGAWGVDQETRSGTSSFGEMQTDADRVSTIARTSASALSTLTTFGEVSDHRVRGDASIVSAFTTDAQWTAVREASHTLSPLRSTADITVPAWTIGGAQITHLTAESRTWQSLTLQFRVNLQTLRSHVRELDTDAGKFDVVERPDGSYRAIDRTGGAIQFELSPPDERGDLRQSGEWIVDEYDERLVDQQGEIYRVTVTLHPLEPKASTTTDTPSWDEENEWRFTFADGEIATNRIEQNITRGDRIEGTQSIELTLDRDEAIVLESSLNRQAAIRILDVADGPVLAEDINADDRNTVTIETPTERDPEERIVEAGEYVVTRFETRLINDEYFQAELSVVPTAD